MSTDLSSKTDSRPTFRPAAVLLHAAAASAMAYGWLGLQELGISEWINTQKGGHFQFLTIQGLFVAWGTMTMSLVLEVFPSITAIRALKRTLFMIAMPLATIISPVYWSLLIFFPSLILRPARGGQSESSSSQAAPELVRIPLSIDLALHAVPAISLLLDFFLFEKKYTAKQARIGGFLVASAAGIGYSCWVEYCATFNGIFPYPFLTENPLNIRIVIYVVLTTFAYLFFLVLNAYHWRS